MIDEQTRNKIDFTFYMTVANCQLYSEEQRQEALNQALSIGMRIGYYPVQPMEQQVAQSAAAIDGPNDLDRNVIR